MAGRPVADFTLSASDGAATIAGRVFLVHPPVGNLSDNTITFGQGSGDHVSVFGDLIHNTITFGNGNGDYVTNIVGFVGFFFAGQSSSNTIIMGNGTGDSVNLGSGAGGDIIITGTGLDTVAVRSHTNADTFGFALGTGISALSQTTVTGARATDKIGVGNSSGLVLTSNGLGNTLVQDGAIAGLSTVRLYQLSFFARRVDQG